MPTAAMCDHCRKAVPFSSQRGQIPAPDGWFMVLRGFDLPDLPPMMMAMTLPDDHPANQLPALICSYRCLAAWAMIGDALYAD